MNKEQALKTKLDIYFKKDNLTEDEKVKLETIKTQIDQKYIDTAKGAFIRSRKRWLEKGEKIRAIFL